MNHSFKSLRRVWFREEISIFFYSKKFAGNFRKLLLRACNLSEAGDFFFIYVQHLRNKVLTVNGIPRCSCNKLINSIIHGIIPHSYVYCK